MNKSFLKINVLAGAIVIAIDIVTLYLVGYWAIFHTSNLKPELIFFGLSFVLIEIYLGGFILGFGLLSTYKIAFIDNKIYNHSLKLVSAMFSMLLICYSGFYISLGSNRSKLDLSLIMSFLIFPVILVWFLFMLTFKFPAKPTNAEVLDVDYNFNPPNLIMVRYLKLLAGISAFEAFLSLLVEFVKHYNNDDSFIIVVAVSMAVVASVSGLLILASRRKINNYIGLQNYLSIRALVPIMMITVLSMEAGLVRLAVGNISWLALVIVNTIALVISYFMVLRLPKRLP